MIFIDADKSQQTVFTFTFVFRDIICGAASTAGVSTTL